MKNNSKNKMVKKTNNILLRVRTKAGTWRIPDVDPSKPLKDFITQVEKEQNVKVTKISLQQNFSAANEPDRNKSLTKLGLKNGDMIFMEIGAGVVVVGGTRREIDADGKLVSTADQAEKKSFLPGLQALGDQKQNWTLTEMAELQDKYTYKITGKKDELCAKASLDSVSSQNFANYYATQLRYQSCRCGILYGRVVDSDNEKLRKELELQNETRSKKYGDNKKNMTVSDLANSPLHKDAAKHAVVVESIYEPPQNNTQDKFELLEDPNESTVEKVAETLGLQKVGIIVCHPRTSDYTLSSDEIITAANISLEASNGQRSSPFVVVRVMLDLQNAITFEAFSLTETCLDMVAEGAIEPLNAGNASQKSAEVKANKSLCAVVSPFVAIVEAKKATVVDNDFFIKPVPIGNYESKLKASFARINRNQSMNEVSAEFKKHVKAIAGARKSGSLNDVDMENILGDFHVLLYLGKQLGYDDAVRAMCEWVGKRTLESSHTDRFQDGFKLLVMNLAGLE